MIGKPNKDGWREVFVYSPAHKRKLYVGRRKNLRGPDGALELERQKIAEFTGKPTAPLAWTCADYAERWLERHHGQGTRRPVPSTRQQNASVLGQLKNDTLRSGSFLATFGGREMSAITREQALDWAREHSTQAKVVSAMFNDAVDDGRATTNPFGNRRLPTKRGRRDIEPLTESEILKLADLARDAWNEYGLIVAGWVVFLAWTGCRPGEASSRTWDDVDLENGLLTVPRIKGDKQTDMVVLPPAAVAALRAMPAQCAANDRDAGLLFLTAQGKPYTIGSFGYYWKPVRAAFVASLEPDRKKRLLAVKGALDVYALRHYCASIMADRGANEFEISAQLGNSPEVCRDIYVHVHRDRVNERNAEFLRDNVRSLDERRRTGA